MTPDPSSAAWLNAMQAEAESLQKRTEIRSVAITVTLVAAMFLASVTYCTSRPPSPPSADDLSIIRARETCAARGMNWIPIQSVVGGASQAFMTCVTDTALPAILARNKELPD